MIPFLLPALVATVASAAPFFDIRNPGDQSVVEGPVTLGHVFAPGDIPAGKFLSARSPTGAAMPLQVDAKAVHADGSLRHAVLTLSAGMAAGQATRVQLSADGSASLGEPLAAADLLATSYDATVRISLDGKAYVASARSALQAAVALGAPKTWLSGPLVTEWLVSAPLVAAPADAHPHLHVRFAIRAYAGLKSVRTDMAVENGWAFEPGPAGFTYDAVVESGSRTVFSRPGLAHTHHARWRKVFWWGEEPSLGTKLDADYLFSTRAVPAYDRGVKPTESALAALASIFEPMSSGDLTSYMPATGAHSDIGPLPRFAALYLLGMDSRAKANVLANGSAGGSYQIHYRDKEKDLPVSIDDYPYMTILGNPGDTRNPATGKSEAFPAVTGGLEKHVPDDAHQPSIAYLPYLITGDHFHLEELHFWTQWNMILANPGYREREKGLLKWSQVRGQAWSLRTLGQAAYITPDSHPLKASLLDKLKNNIDWYVRNTSGNTAANKLGWLDAGYARAYEPNGVAPWQDDFFTWTAGYLFDLGFSEARELARWKSKFVVGRFMDPGYCWLQAPAYSLQIGPADRSSEYATFAELYQANFPTAAACTGNVMSGYPDNAEGYGANMQPALAAAVDVGIPGAAEAWARYQTRNPKQSYPAAPQWAVVPKDLPGASLRRSGSSVKHGRLVRLRWLPALGRLAIQRGQGEDARYFDLAGKPIGSN